MTPESWRIVTAKSVVDARGRLTVVERPPCESAESREIAFPSERVYWVNAPGKGVIRGGHAHRETDQLFFCLTGLSACEIRVGEAAPAHVILDGYHPEVGLYVPRMVWHTFDLAAGSVVLALASRVYDEADYIRDYDRWLDSAAFVLRRAA